MSMIVTEEENPLVSLEVVYQLNYRENSRLLFKSSVFVITIQISAKTICSEVPSIDPIRVDHRDDLEHEHLAKESCQRVGLVHQKVYGTFHSI